MHKKGVISSKAKSGSMIALVKDYTKSLKKYLETGREKPNPQLFMDRYTKKSHENDLRIQLNMTTLLTLYGRKECQLAEKGLEKGDFLEKAKQRLFDKIKKSNGTQ